MKKFLRFVVVLLLVVVAGILILGLIAPKDVEVSRTVMIHAPKEAVFAQITNFKNWTNWSPWYKMEPNVQMAYSGPDGQVGSSYHWVGKKTGEGEMKLVSANDGKADFDLHFIKPFEANPKSYMIAQDSAGMTKTTWGFKQHYSYPWNAMLVFMDMDKLLGKDFDSGLNNMKQYLESKPAAAAPTSSTQVQQVDYPAHTYEGIRKTISTKNGMGELSKFFGESYGALGKGLGPKIVGPSASITYKWDTVKKEADIMAAFPVADESTKVKGAIFVHAGPAKALLAVHKGGYSALHATHQALNAELAAKGFTKDLVIEEYIITQDKEADSNKWETNVYYLLK